MVLGTTNGGLTWSRVTFRVPGTAPNFYGQSYAQHRLYRLPVCRSLRRSRRRGTVLSIYSDLQLHGPTQLT